ncbi:MAG: hypothetical protein QOC91_1011 [Solirubrobacteraceae bacterium]|nr:hypothetical protein [Solirubrobacteraceae bacterium]
MVEVRRSIKQKVIAGAAVAALVAGGSIAAVSATGQSSPGRHGGAHRHAHRGHARDLAAAAAYLGISPAQLTGELGSGKTLAQIADATAGKSAAGLTEALIATRKALLTSAAVKLPPRVAAEVNRAGGPGSALLRPAQQRAGSAGRIAALFLAPARAGSIAAGYLGVAPARLQSQLRSGQTLAQIADATAGKSSAGLVDALVAAKRSKLAGATAAGRLTRARQAKRLAGLDKRMRALAQRQFAGAGSP